MINGSIEKTGSENHTNPSLYSSSECIVFLTVAITQSVAIVTLNILTIIVFMRNRSLRKRSMYLVINLAVADMLVGSYTEVMDLVQFGGWVCSVWRTVNLPYTEVWGYIIFHVFPFASLTNLAAISLERLHATFRPFKHRVIKDWILGVVITVTWVIAGLFSTAVTLMSWNGSYVSLWNLMMSMVLICLFIIFVSYMSIVIKVYYGAHPQHHGAVSRERKLTKTLFIVTFVSLMAWLPYVVLGFLYANTSTLRSRILRHLHYILVILYYTNSLVNPIMYTVRIPEFRRALVSLFRRQHRSVRVEIPLRVIPCK